MTGYLQLDRAFTLAAEREAQAAAYRQTHRPRTIRLRPARAERPKREPGTHRLGFAGMLFGR